LEAIKAKAQSLWSVENQTNITGYSLSRKSKQKYGPTNNNK